MQIISFHQDARLAYGVQTTNSAKLIPLFHKGQHEFVDQFMSRWGIEVRELPAHCIQFSVAYSLAASGGNHLFYNRDSGARRSIWNSFDKKFLVGDAGLIYAEHGLFGLLVPTVRQITGKMDISRQEIIEPDTQFSIAGKLFAVMLEKMQFDPLRAAIALHTGYIRPHSNDLRVAYRGEFPIKFITAFNSFAEWQHNQQPKEE